MCTLPQYPLLPQFLCSLQMQDFEGFPYSFVKSDWLRMNIYEIYRPCMTGLSCNIPIFSLGNAWFSMRMIYTLHSGLQFHNLPPFMTTTLWHYMYLDCCLLTSSLFTVSRPSLCSLPTAFDFHTYVLFRKPLPPFVSALFREPMHSLSRFYVLFRGPVLTLLPPSFGTVCPLPGTIINLIFTPLPGDLY